MVRLICVCGEIAIKWNNSDKKKKKDRHSKEKDERQKKTSLSCRTFSVIKSEPKTQCWQTKQPAQVKCSAMVTQMVSRHFPQMQSSFL